MRSRRSLRLDPHPPPERHAILDLCRCRLGLRVIPGGVAVDLAVDRDVVVAGDARALVARRRFS